MFRALVHEACHRAANQAVLGVQRLRGRHAPQSTTTTQLKRTSSFQSRVMRSQRRKSPTDAKNRSSWTARRLAAYKVRSFRLRLLHEGDVARLQ